MNTSMNRISEVTRRNILDTITLEKLSWSGRIDEVDFLRRIYDLGAMDSIDPRFSSADGDIWQHRVLNSDWDDDWVFKDGRFNLLHCPDEELLRFLCESIHPVVQPDKAVVAKFLEIYNSELPNDGFEIVETTRVSGRPIYAARDVAISTPAVEAAKNLSDSLSQEYLTRQINRMETAIHTDPELAIGTAKELIETCCKTILRQRGQPVDEGWQIPKLVKTTLDALNLTTPTFPEHDKVAASIRKTLGNLAQVAQGAAELRRLYGTGHGKDATTPAPPPHHARLAVGAASTLVVFLFETHQQDSVGKS